MVPTESKTKSDTSTEEPDDTSKTKSTEGFNYEYYQRFYRPGLSPELQKNTRILNLDDPMDNDNNLVPIIVSNAIVQIRSIHGRPKNYRVKMIKVYFFAHDGTDLTGRKLYAACIAEDGNAIYFDVPFVPTKIRKHPEKLLTESKLPTNKEKKAALRNGTRAKVTPPSHPEMSAAAVYSRKIKEAKTTKQYRLLVNNTNMKFHNGFFNNGVKDNSALKINKKYINIKQELYGKDGKPTGKFDVDAWGYFSVAIDGTKEECVTDDESDDEHDDDELEEYLKQYDSCI